MQIVALLCWFDESPEQLTECVTSCGLIADHVVAVDGRYALYPDERVVSPPDNVTAIREAAEAGGMGLTVYRPNVPFPGEVEKRAFMFHLAESLTTAKDWYLVIDADTTVAKVSENVRGALASRTEDVGEVLFQDVLYSGRLTGPTRFRALFRAVRGLTVQHLHWLYVVPGPRYLWHVPNGGDSPEPAIDLVQEMTLHHRNVFRDSERQKRRSGYYKAREFHQAEKLPTT